MKSEKESINLGGMNMPKKDSDLLRKLNSTPPVKNRKGDKQELCTLRNVPHTFSSKLEQGDYSPKIWEARDIRKIERTKITTGYTEHTYAVSDFTKFIELEDYVKLKKDKEQLNIIIGIMKGDYEKLKRKRIIIEGDNTFVYAKGFDAGVKQADEELSKLKAENDYAYKVIPQYTKQIEKLKEQIGMGTAGLIEHYEKKIKDSVLLLEQKHERIMGYKKEISLLKEQLEDKDKSSDYILKIRNKKIIELKKLETVSKEKITDFCSFIFKECHKYSDVLEGDCDCIICQRIYKLLNIKEE